MKKVLLGIAVLLTQGSALADSLSLGWLKADLVATQLRYRKVAPDDVNPTQFVLGVYLTVKNVGHLAVTPGSGQHPAIIGSRQVRGAVYGPASRGGRLGDKLFPGETGLMSFYLPLGSLRHCAGTLTHIDLNHTLQTGGASVFTNDRKNLTAYESGNPRPCELAPLPRP